MQQISEYSYTKYWELSDHNIKLEKYVREADAMGEINPDMGRDEKIKFVQRKLRNVEPEANAIQARMEKFNPAFFEFTDYFDNLTDRFDINLITNCNQFIDLSSNQYIEVMRKVQTTSAVIFFILVHIPLSRYHSSMSFLTALMPLTINLKTKYWFYEKANDFVLLFFKKDKHAKNYV